MTASASAAGKPDDRSLARGVSPAVIHAALFPEDRDEFVAAYNAALDEARASLHLGPVHEVVEEWRRRAVLQSDPEAFRRSVRRAAEFVTGQPVPAEEPFAVTRAKASM